MVELERLETYGNNSNLTFKEVVSFTLNDENLLVRGTSWPKFMYCQFKYNEAYRCYMCRYLVLSKENGLTPTSSGWTTNITIEMALANDYEMYQIKK